MSGQPGVDPLAVLAALGIDDASDPVPVPGGWDAAIWRVRHAGRDWALRVFRPEQALMARHEALVMGLARRTAPVPEIAVAGEWQGRAAMLLEWCPGRTLAEELRARPLHARALGIAFGRTQARIHAAPTGHELNDLAGRWLLAAGPQEQELRRRLRAVAGPSVLLHLDYHPLNVMIDGDAVSGVLDWSNALPGDRRADLARTLSILRLMGGVPDSLGLRERVVLRLFERGWLAGYRAEAGPVADLAVFNAWAGALMQRDLAPRVGRPETGLTEAHMAAIRRWTTTWKQRAGIEQR